MTPTPTKSKEEYNPIYCDHKKPNGFSAYDLQSHYSGSGPEHGKEVKIFVCLKCGRIKIWGKEIIDDKWQYFSEEFSIDHPVAVSAIVKNCNFMHKETDYYTPFVCDQQTAELTRENEALKGLVSKLAEYCPVYEEEYWTEIRKALNPEQP